MEKSDWADRRRDAVEEDCVDELKQIVDRNLADLSDVEQTVIRRRFNWQQAGRKPADAGRSRADHRRHQGTRPPDPEQGADQDPRGDGRRRAANGDRSRSQCDVHPSEVPAIDELTFFFAMLLPFNRVMRNPTLKDEIRDKGLGDNYSFGFPMYAVGQCADILAFRPELVPVGEDQLPHLEMTREVARRFDQMYCGVDPQTEDKDYRKPAAFPGDRSRSSAA
jgi:hypothetical protein